MEAEEKHAKGIRRIRGTWTNFAEDSRAPQSPSRAFEIFPLVESLLDGKERGARREQRLSHRSSGRRETMDRPENASIGFF